MKILARDQFNCSFILTEILRKFVSRFTIHEFNDNSLGQAATKLANRKRSGDAPPLLAGFKLYTFGQKLQGKKTAFSG
ncbi:unnamed protein product [marine sediment metagenome]|uniref:Uncharacterized protein n=1 Tax=marine sediment metagenome TaxID=412755 RepID=X1F276_9ZZZZ